MQEQIAKQKEMQSQNIQSHGAQDSETQRQEEEMPHGDSAAPKVSIIVPVYNAEKALRRCVDSILNQEFTDFEVILVDDGSKDSSGAICDGYAAADSRVRVLHKENTGVSDTRNMALDMARGAYLQFLDSDDWITPDATKLFVRTAEEKDCDLVISDFYRVAGERVSRKGDLEENEVMSREEFAGHMMEKPADFYYGVLWNKLYRREIVERYQIRMDAEVRWCEDFLFNLEYILHGKRFCALQVPLYYYVKTEGSLVSQNVSLTKTVKMKRMVFSYYNEFFKSVYDEEDYEKKKLQVYRYLIDAAGDGIVPPAILPGAKKLGSERTPVDPKVIGNDGFFMDEYRNRKLLDRYLEIVSLAENLSLNEVRLLLYLSQPHGAGNRRELADFADMPYSSLLATLQLLAVKGLVKMSEVRAGEDKKEGKRLHIQFTPEAKPALNGITAAIRDFDEARFAGFTEEEKIQYARLNQKMKENILRVLR